MGGILLRRNVDITFLILVAILVLNSFRSGAFSSPMEWLMNELMLLPGIIIGLSFHEYAHALTAYKLGDPTPKMQGRVTINPLAHIDPLGLIALLFAGFGWGVPVQIDPSNFKKRRRDELIVSVAGVAMNLLVAAAFTVIAKILYMTVGAAFLSGSVGSIIWYMVMYVIQINLVLMIFNLMPIPPLDGFSIISEIFNLKTTNFYWTLYRYGNLILVAFIIFGIANMILSPCVSFLFSTAVNFIF